MSVVAPSVVADAAPSLTRQEALARARAIAAVAAPRVAEAEARRRLPDATVKALIDSELCMLLAPKAWGGFGLDWGTALDCIVEVGKSCASTAWCLSFLIDHNWVLALFPEEVQAMVYARDPQPRIFTASAPEGSVRSAPGGYIVDGEWSFASGVHHCDWGLVGAVLTDAGEPQYLNIMIPPGSYTVLDTWRHFGLRATGSTNIVVKDLFVPAVNAVPWSILWTGQAPGQEVNPEPLYRLPMNAAYPLGILGPMLGAAKGALEDFAAWTATKIGKRAPGPVSESVGMQMRIGEASARIGAGECLLRKNVALISRPEPLTLDERAEISRDYMFACELLTEGMDVLMNAGGARGGRDDNALQRNFRDVHAMRQHAVFNFEVNYATAGRMAMGMGPDPRSRM